MQAATPWPAPGALVGGSYRITTEIARGAMGVVLSAVDQVLERNVAIKLVRAELLDADHRRRFMDEARIMAQLNHPNVVRIYAFGEHGTLPYFVMERVEGSNLERWLVQHQQSDFALALRILNDVCVGVCAIHAAGAVHRDLKPSNILIDAELGVRIADFGASVHARTARSPDVVGTPGYMPPEALLPSAESKGPCPRHDVYALGCIAYELLTGRHPFRLRGEAARAVVTPHDTPTAPPSRVRPGLPRGIDRVLLSALEPDVLRRTPSVAAFRAELLRFVPRRSSVVATAATAHEGCGRRGDGRVEG